MAEYVISCCSTADMSIEYQAKRGIPYICFHFSLDDKTYPDDYGKSMPLDQFYQAMANGSMTKTSQVNAEEFEEYFEGFLKEGKDILHVTLASGISGVVNSAMIAKSILEDKYPERKIYVVDSLTASSGYGLLMDKLADLRDSGMGIDELYAWTTEHLQNQQTWFFTTDLTYLVRGGRVSKASGFVGGLLNICPLMCVNNEGKLVARAKVRTKRKVIQALVDKMAELCEDGENYSEKVFLSHSACYDDARAVADLVEKRFPKMNGKVEIFNIGTTIGSHTGPGTVALAFWGKKKDA